MDREVRPIGRVRGRALVVCIGVVASLLVGCGGQASVSPTPTVAAPATVAAPLPTPTAPSAPTAVPTPGSASPTAAAAATGPTSTPDSASTPAAMPTMAPTGTPAAPATATAAPTVAAVPAPTCVAASPPPDESIWSTRAPLLEPNSELAVAELDGKIYAMGGYPATRVYVATVQVYDARADRWEYGVPLPQPLHHPMAAAVDGLLYVIGGEISRTGVANQGIFLDTVYAFDPATGQWTSKASMPTARSAGATAVVDGKIYVAGGRPPRGQDFAVYDPAADAWTVLPDLPTQRNHLAAAALGGKVYVVGGRFGGGVGSEMTDIVEVYDPATRAWSRAAPMPTRRAGINGIAARGCFYVFGGEGNDTHPRGVFPQNEVYDPRTDTWQTLESLPTPVHGVTGAAYLDGVIHLPGGGLARGGNSGATIHQVFRAEVDCEGTPSADTPARFSGP